MKNPDRYRSPVAGIPIDALPDTMKRSLAAVEREWPAKIAITIFVCDFGNYGALSYISNANRDDMLNVVREWLKHQESLT